MDGVRTGLDRLVDAGMGPLLGKRVGLVCHAASVDRAVRHITTRCVEAGVNVVRCFGPEHGIWSDLQDMIAADDDREPVTGAPVVSLYGADEASLSPSRAQLDGIDLLVIDLQDVGARYYTYVYTAALCARAAGEAGVPVLLLDRPNPIGGVQVEGGLQGDAFRSFVGMWPLPHRHGLTVGEVVRVISAREGFRGTIDIHTVEGWTRDQYFEETGLPWVQPSPNMPTVETAVVYPGGCLFEGTNMSEGRGTTRPFELVGAGYIDDPFRLVSALEEAPLTGVDFRPVFFQPTFHKFGRETIGGVGIHVRDRSAFQPLRCGLHILATVRRLWGDAFQWRTEVYEFVQDRLAIDLLFGDDTTRGVIDGGGDVDAVWQRWAEEARAFEIERRPHLLYPMPGDGSA